MVTIYVKQNEPQLSQEIIAKIYELRKQGLSFRAIGRELGIPHETVHRYLDSEYREKVCNQHRLKRQEGARKAFLTRVENQRKTLTGYEIGYLEAMIDGEGYLGLLPSRGNGKLRWNIRLSIGNTCKELTEKVRSIVGKGAITYNKPRGRNSQSWTYMAGPTILRWLLPQLTLINKEMHRRLILEALELTHGDRGIGHYGENTTRLIEIDGILKNLNTRRPRDG